VSLVALQDTGKSSDLASDFPLLSKSNAGTRVMNVIRMTNSRVQDKIPEIMNKR
jgi:hypothetical protein